MSLKKTILKNFASLMTSTIIARLLTLAIVIIIARYLGKEQFGIYVAAQAFVGMFVILFGLGSEFGFVYEGSKNKKAIGWFLGSGIILKFILGFVSLFIIILVAHLLGYSSIHISIIAIFIFIWFFITFQNFLSGVFQIQQRMEFEIDPVAHSNPLGDPQSLIIGTTFHAEADAAALTQEGHITRMENPWIKGNV